VARSTVELIVDAQKAINPLKRVTAETKKLDRVTRDVNGRLRDSKGRFVATGQAATGAAKGVDKLSASIKRLVAGIAFFQAGKFVILKTAELERQTKSLEVLTGSLGNARNIIQELQQFGAVTPFTSSELIETAKRLKAFGFETEQVVDVTKRLADVAGATGADLGGIATAFGQIQAKGRLQGEELLQLQERGVSLQDELQKMYGLTADEFRKALEGGRISADAVNIALQNITKTGGKYAGGAIAQSDTLAGKFSTLIDGIENISRTIGEVLSPALKGTLGLAIDVVNSINAAFNAQKRLTGFGISDQERNKLFKQAGEEAKQLALLRGGGKLDPGEFTRIRAQRFSDLINAFGFETGQLIPEIDKPQTQTKLPGLLKKTGPGSSGGKTQVEKDAEAAQKIADASAERVTTLKEQTTLAAALTEEERKQFERQINIASILENKRGLTETQLKTELEATLALYEQQDATAAITEENKKQADAKAAAQAEEKKRAAELQSVYQGIGDTIADGVVNSLKGAVDGTTSLAEAATNLLDDLANQLLQVARNMLFFGNLTGTLTKGSGILGTIFGGFMANGGTTKAGKSYVVGEKGPELFTPGVTGTVTPNSALGGSNIVVNVDASGSSVEGDAQQSKALGQAIGAAVQAEIIKQKMPGGLLN